MGGNLTPREPRGLRTWFERDAFSNLREEMDDLLSRFFGGNEPRGGALMNVAPLELSETPQDIRVRLDVPGLKPEDIDIQISGNALVIRGERKEEKEEKDRTFHRVERRVGEFTRSVALPNGVDTKHVDAQYRDGVLCVTLRKLEATQPQRIQVKG